MTMRTLTLIGAVAALLAGGCGDDDGAAGPYVDALVEQFESTDAFPLETEQTRCLAEGFVDTVGVDQLEERDITPEELAVSGDPRELGIETGQDEADGLADAISGCDVSVGYLLLGSALEAGAEIPDDLSDCIDENVDEDAFYDLFAQILLGQEAVNGAQATTLFADARDACPGFTEIVG